VLPGMSLFICDDALTSMDYCIALDNLLDYWSDYYTSIQIRLLCCSSKPNTRNGIGYLYTVQPNKIIKQYCISFPRNLFSFTIPSGLIWMYMCPPQFICFEVKWNRI
jgi:hypothetical protein